MQIEYGKRWLSRSLIALILSAVYLHGYPSATIFYVVADLLHVALGIVLTPLLVFFLRVRFPAKLFWLALDGSHSSVGRFSVSC